jgi:hypothetical protein
LSADRAAATLRSSPAPWLFWLGKNLCRAQRELNNYSQVIYGESWMPEGHYMSYRSEAQSLAEDLQQKLEDIGLAGDNNFPEINELEVYAEDLEDLKLLNAEQGRQWDLIITEINSINDSSIT